MVVRFVGSFRLHSPLDDFLLLSQSGFDGVYLEGLFRVILVKILYVCLDFLLDVFQSVLVGGPRAQDLFDIVCFLLL